MAEEIIIVQGTGVLAGRGARVGREELGAQAHGGLPAGAAEPPPSTTFRSSPTSRSWARCSAVWTRTSCARAMRSSWTRRLRGPGARLRTSWCRRCAPASPCSGPLVGRFGTRARRHAGRLPDRRPQDRHAPRGAGGAGRGVRRGPRLSGGHHAARPGTAPASMLDFPSVGATENLLMAAVAAEGTTHRRECRARAGDRRSGEHARTPWAPAWTVPAPPLIEVEGVPARVACTPASTQPWATA